MFGNAISNLANSLKHIKIITYYHPMEAFKRKLYLLIKPSLLHKQANSLNVRESENKSQ
jgi:hypothetical protein